MGKAVNVEIDPNKDSSEYIFDVLFEVKVRNVDLISEQELKNYGSYSTGMELFDQDNMTQLVSANLSIAQMAEHRSKGYHLRYVHPRDVLKIYEFTQHHLNRWVSALTMTGGSLNGGGAPLNDLMILDRYCSEVYEQAKFYDQAKLTSLEQRYGIHAGFGAIQKMFEKSNTAKEDKLKEITVKHRKGFSDLFQEIQVKRNPVEFSPVKKSLNG